MRSFLAISLRNQARGSRRPAWHAERSSMPHPWRSQRKPRQQRRARRPSPPRHQPRACAHGAPPRSSPRQQRRILVLRGLPGTGKRTWLQARLDSGALDPARTAVCCADDYFDAHSVPYAHTDMSVAYRWCKLQFYTAVEGGTETVVLMNPHIKPGSLQFALRTARQHGISAFEVHDFECATEAEAIAATARSRRSMPATLQVQLWRAWRAWRGRAGVVRFADTLAPSSPKTVHHTDASPVAQHTTAEAAVVATASAEANSARAAEGM